VQVSSQTGNIGAELPTVGPLLWGQKEISELAADLSSRKNGLLFESPDDLVPQMKMLTQAQRLVQVLAGGSDAARRHSGAAIRPARRARAAQITLDNMTWPMTLAANTIEKSECGAAGGVFPGTSWSRARRPRRDDLLSLPRNPGATRLFRTRAWPKGERRHPQGRRRPRFLQKSIRRGCG